ncbi:acylphosphatase [Candidatus Methanocrinis alkalitolerans]|uniref:acylphosphatase n=1 Tax=Candidatus Methanocrinis alkalitolerans TaxID=3033395 RepID=UPI00374311C9
MMRLTARVSGRVQMVGYRARVVGLARSSGLVGFVQNLPDGRVEVEDGELSHPGRRCGDCLLRGVGVFSRISQGNRPRRGGRPSG